MADGKKSFIAYCEWIDLIDDLEDEEVGKVCKWLFNYVNDNNPDFPIEKHLKVICKVMKSQLKADLVKWEDERQKRSDAGKKGMASRWQKDNTVITSDNKNNNVKNEITKISDYVNDNVYVNDNDNVCVNTHNNNACVREEEENVEKLQALYKELETLFGRCLTNAECITIREFSKTMSNESIIRDLGSYVDKANPIAYMKKMLENARNTRVVKRGYDDSELLEDDWLKEFNERCRQEEEQRKKELRNED